MTTAPVDADLFEHPPGPPGPPRPPTAAPPARPSRPWLNVGLFCCTFLSALLSQLAVSPREGLLDILLVPLTQPWRLAAALPFAVTLMAILLAHEMGHYLTARHYGVDQSLPYFIPAPTLFGTLGAVIFMRSQPHDRRVLLNVAVNGPYAGLVLAVPAAAWGLMHSVPLLPGNQVAGLQFGDSLLFRALELVFSPNGTDVILHPVAMAAWVGLFVTSLNLIPAAQLDGGHVAYALFGRHQVKLSLAIVVLLLTGGMGVTFLGASMPGGGGAGGEMWIIWALLLFAIGLRHPPVQDETLPLTPRQKLNGAFALLVFVLTFIPIPVRYVDASAPAAPAIQSLPWGSGSGTDGGPRIRPFGRGGRYDGYDGGTPRDEAGECDQDGDGGGYDDYGDDGGSCDDDGRCEDGEDGDDGDDDGGACDDDGDGGDDDGGELDDGDDRGEAPRLPERRFPARDTFHL